MNTTVPDEGTPAYAERVRELNDALRRSGRGGRVVVTAGIADAGPVTVAAIVGAVAKFEAFSPENDPWDEHDCAALSVFGVDVLFKIDYYDTQLCYHSPNAADPDVTIRVLTIMRVDEY